MEGALLRDAAAAYIVAKAARDMRLDWWIDRLAHLTLAQLADGSDTIADLLEQYASEPARKFLRKTSDGA